MAAMQTLTPMNPPPMDVPPGPKTKIELPMPGDTNNQVRFMACRCVFQSMEGLSEMWPYTQFRCSACNTPKAATCPVLAGWLHAKKPACTSCFSLLVCLQYGGTRTVREGYTFDVAHQIGEGTYGQVFVGNCKKDKVKVSSISGSM